MLSTLLPLSSWRRSPPYRIDTLTRAQILPRAWVSVCCFWSRLTSPITLTGGNSSRRASFKDERSASVLMSFESNDNQQPSASNLETFTPQQVIDRVLTISFSSFWYCFIVFSYALDHLVTKTFNGRRSQPLVYQLFLLLSLDLDFFQ